MYSRILGTGSYLPKNILTNADLEKIVETNDAWIVERTGIRERHIADPKQGESCNFMATEAAKKALASAEIPADAIDLVIVATCSPDQLTPSTACIVQHNLGLPACPAFDLGAACSGFVYALSVADKFIRTGSARHALVIASEVVSRVINWQDRGTCILFGDGASAVVLGASEQPGILSTHLYADGQYQDLLNTNTIWPDIPGEALIKPYMQMKGNEVFKVAVTKLNEMVDTTLQANGLSKADLDWLVPHQANLRIISAIAKKLDMSMEQVVVTVDQHGNTSAASVPLALDQAIRDGRIKRGQTLLLESFGAGFAWASALLVY